MKKLIGLIVLAILSLGHVGADCIGNTTGSVECGGFKIEGTFEGMEGTFVVGGETWCCTPVGDGSDYSCTDGESWELSSELGCGTPN